jgi:hypothetical protein
MLTNKQKLVCKHKRARNASPDTDRYGNNVVAKALPRYTGPSTALSRELHPGIQASMPSQAWQYRACCAHITPNSPRATRKLATPGPARPFLEPLPCFGMGRKLVSRMPHRLAIFFALRSLHSRQCSVGQPLPLAAQKTGTSARAARRARMLCICFFCPVTIHGGKDIGGGWAGRGARMLMSEIPPAALQRLRA